MNPKVDHYLAEGCGRCPLGGTPACKVHLWEPELELLRNIALDCMLTEELKWGVPCYTHQGKNILIVAAFKEYASINFFKGSLMNNELGLLVSPGENSQSGRMMRFTKLQEIIDLQAEIKAAIFEAIELEKSGAKVQFKKVEEFPVPEEFQRKLEQMPELKTAFHALTPGRQRGYLLHFSQPKQSKTREERIEKCVDLILQGKGYNEDYKKR